MRQMSVHQFRSQLEAAVEGVVREHEPLRVTRRGGEDFVVVSAEDWERERETQYVLENRSLMEQIARSLASHAASGRPATREELDGRSSLRATPGER
jgi:antitoxin YefM